MSGGVLLLRRYPAATSAPPALSRVSTREGERRSLVLYEGGSVGDLAACAGARDVTALYVLEGGDWVSHILGAPAFVNRPFAELCADGIPAVTALAVRSDGPSTAAAGR